LIGVARTPSRLVGIDSDAQFCSGLVCLTVDPNSNDIAFTDLGGQPRSWDWKCTSGVGFQNNPIAPIESVDYIEEFHC
jgi:hypothetical protein